MGIQHLFYSPGPKEYHNALGLFWWLVAKWSNFVGGVGFRIGGILVSISGTNATCYSAGCIRMFRSYLSFFINNATTSFSPFWFIFTSLSASNKRCWGSDEIANSNQMMETEFVQKLKEIESRRRGGSPRSNWCLKSSSSEWRDIKEELTNLEPQPLIFCPCATWAFFRARKLHSTRRLQKWMSFP